MTAQRIVRLYLLLGQQQRANGRVVYLARAANTYVDRVAKVEMATFTPPVPRSSDGPRHQ